MFRKTIFWTHLCLGVIAGAVVLMMSFTGVLLTYERQILAWQDRAYSSSPGADQTKLAVETLLLLGSDDTFTPTDIVVSSDPAAPLILRAGRSSRYLNPYSGAVYPTRDDTVDRFLSAVTGWHRWFNVTGDNRTVARAITGACNLMFLFLILSGMYLWLPSVFKWITFRSRVWFHTNARAGQARDFNWHHVFGFWSAIPLIVIVATATVFNYAWANNLVYRLAGEEPPVRQQTSNAAASEIIIPPQPIEPLSVSSLIGIAAESELASGWKTLSMRLPSAESPDVNIAIDTGDGGQPQKRHTLILDGGNGEIRQWIPFNSQTPGQQARRWVRFLHTGEALGLTGQTIAGLVSLFATLMVWTGISLSLRRLQRFLKRKKVFGHSENEPAGLVS